MFLGLSLKHNDLLPHSRGNAGQILAGRPEQDAMPSCWSLREQRCFFARGINSIWRCPEAGEEGDTAVYLDFLNDLRFELLRRF